MPALAPAAEQIRARLDARCHANDRHWELTQPAHLPDSVVLMAGICCIEKVLDVVGLYLDPPEMVLLLAVDGEEPDPGPRTGPHPSCRFLKLIDAVPDGLELHLACDNYAQGPEVNQTIRTLKDL